MYTRCPQCQTLHTLTLQQLRNNRGILQCNHCSTLFDALKLISETENGTVDSMENTRNKTLPWDSKAPARTFVWGAGASACLLLLILQIQFFEGYALTQNPKFRPILTALCRRVNCRLPDYKNLEALNLVGSFNATPDHFYEFRAAISNQAPFPQAYPGVKLVLLNFSGNPFAARIFQPQDYLPAAMQSSAIKPDETTEISLKIAEPKSKIGGSFFELVN